MRAGGGWREARRATRGAGRAPAAPGVDACGRRTGACAALKRPGCAEGRRSKAQRAAGGARAPRSRARAQRGPAPHARVCIVGARSAIPVQAPWWHPRWTARAGGATATTSIGACSVRRRGWASLPLPQPTATRRSSIGCVSRVCCRHSSDEHDQGVARRSEQVSLGIPAGHGRSRLGCSAELACSQNLRTRFCHQLRSWRHELSSRSES